MVSIGGTNMSASNFNLRGIPLEVMALLKREAKRLHMSVNALALSIIERGLGVTRERPTHHDLDHLAGSWSSKEEEAFYENIKSFEKVDKDLWK